MVSDVLQSRQQETEENIKCSQILGEKQLIMEQDYTMRFYLHFIPLGKKKRTTPLSPPKKNPKKQTNNNPKEAERKAKKSSALQNWSIYHKLLRYVIWPGFSDSLKAGICKW